MTTPIEALLEAVRADLDDDEARLVYADALQAAGDPRGELIAVQCKLAQLGFPAPRPSSACARTSSAARARWRWRARRGRGASGS